MGQDDIEDSGSSGSESPSTDIDGPPPLAHNESVAVKRSKWLVLFALIGAAAVVAGLVYYIASSDERANFMKEVSVTCRARLLSCCFDHSLIVFYRSVDLRCAPLTVRSLQMRS